MNRCKWCGRFRRWEDLVSVENLELDIYGGLSQQWYMECRDKCENRKPIKL